MLWSLERIARRFWILGRPLALVLGLIAFEASALAVQEQPEGASKDLLEELKTYRHKIVHESFRDGNWELYIMNADGSEPVNLTKTPDVEESYPKVSPDGASICFQADEGKGEAKARCLYLMNLDGTHRVKIAEDAREPCWSADGKQVAYLPNEFNKFTYADGATKGIRIYDLATKETREHPNKEILHLYTLNWSSDGKWFVATIHGGMGFKHGILALEANGNGVFDLGLKGCRPDLSPDGKKVAWGHGDFAMGCADLDLGSSPPKATGIHNMVESGEFETYHVDWSPDGKYIAYSYGPKFKGKNLKGLLPEFPGVEAPGWNTCVADASKKNRWVQVTFDGKSNKEPDWVFVKETPKK
jgi:Tol biopolymer transport system component